MADYIDLGSASLNFLLGPQTDPATDTENAAIVRFSGNTRTDPLTRAPQAIAQDAPYPWAVGAAKAGTIAFSGGATITGTGTSFLTDLPSGGNLVLDIPASSDPLGEGFGYVLLVGVPTSDTSAPVNATYGGSQWGPYLGALSGLPYHLEVATVDGVGFGGVQEKLMYYDFGFCLYQSAYKHAATTDGATLMANADTVAKLWWRHPTSQTARRIATVGDSGILWQGSRHEALGTLVAWALRGCPGDTSQVTAVWDYCYRAALAAYNQWLAGKGTADHIAFDTRDGGYALHWLTMLSVVHPDSTPRADCRAKALDAALNYFIRLQYPDGTWRAQNDAFWFNATTHTADEAVMQAFLVSLLIESLVDLHRSIKDDPTYASESATILASIKQGVEGLQLCYGGWPNHSGYTAVTGGGNAPVRGMTYAFGDANLGYDATTFAEAIPGDPNGNRWYDPKRSIEDNYATDGVLSSAVAATRFLNSTSVHAPYYAALYEADATKRANYLAFGEELFKAQWEYTDGDGFRSQWYTAAPKNKDWDEHMRAQMRGLAWRKMAVAGLTEEDIGAPTQLLLSTPPAGVVSGMTLTTQPAGTVADSGGSTVTSDTSTITASWVLLTGDAVPTGTLTTTASSGAWAFTNLGLSWSSPSMGYWHFTDGALTAVNSATMTLPVAIPTPSLVLPTVVDQWRPTQRNREGLEVVPSASPLIGTGGTTVANSGTTSVLIPVGRVRVSVLSLSLDAMTAAGSSGTVTVQAFKVSGGASTALTTALSIKTDVISAAGNVSWPVLTALFDGPSNGTRRIDGTRGDTLRVDIVASGTITQQPQVRVVAELAVNG